MTVALQTDTGVQTAAIEAIMYHMDTTYAPHSDAVVAVYRRVHREGPSWANGGPGTEFSIACRANADSARLARVLRRQVELATREALAVLEFDFGAANHVAALACRHWRRHGAPLAGTFGGADTYADAYITALDRAAGC